MHVESASRRLARTWPGSGWLSKAQTICICALVMRGSPFQQQSKYESLTMKKQQSRNCSEKFLPAMSSICSTHLVQEDQHRLDLNHPHHHYHLHQHNLQIFTKLIIISFTTQCPCLQKLLASVSGIQFSLASTASFRSGTRAERFSSSIWVKVTVIISNNMYLKRSRYKLLCASTPSNGR